MKINFQGFAAIIFVVLIMMSACSSASSGSTPSVAGNLDGATLVQERCSACHPITRIESKHYTASEWKATVNLMVSKGARLTSEEKATVINYLSSEYGQ